MTARQRVDGPLVHQLLSTLRSLGGPLNLKHVMWDAVRGLPRTYAIAADLRFDALPEGGEALEGHHIHRFVEVDGDLVEPADRLTGKRQHLAGERLVQIAAAHQG